MARGRMLLCAAGLAAAALTVGCGRETSPRGSGTKPQTKGETVMDIEVTSRAFDDGEPIPQKHAYEPEGENISPPLSWQNVPAAAKELVLIMDDPDAPHPDRPRAEGPWVHWVIYKIPAQTEGLAQGVPAEPTPGEPQGAVQGRNSWDEIGYGGPFPPEGPAHRYRFHVYAVDTPLELEPGLNKQQVLNAIQGHMVGQGELVGTYQR